MLLQTAVLFAVLELLAGQVLEPVVFGHSSGLSPVAIIVSASFWTWLWGPVGLVLATPLTICLVVVGRHVDRLQFLDIMLGDQPPLTPSQLLYQRLLAGDPTEAAEQARDYLKSASLEDYYDSVLSDGLGLAAADNRLGHLDDERLSRITATVGELADDLSSHEDVKALEAPPEVDTGLGALVTIERTGEKPTSPSEVWKAARSILCIPGFSKLDEAAAIVLAQGLGRRGYGATAEQADALSVSRFFSLDLAGTELVCLCYVDRPSNAKIQYAVRRLAKKSKAADIIVLLLGSAAEGSVGEQMAGLPAVTSSFASAMDAVEQKAIETAKVAVAAEHSAPSASVPA